MMILFFLFTKTEEAVAHAQRALQLLRFNETQI